MLANQRNIVQHSTIKKHKQYLGIQRQIIWVSGFGRTCSTARSTCLFRTNVSADYGQVGTRKSNFEQPIRHYLLIRGESDFAKKDYNQRHHGTGKKEIGGIQICVEIFQKNFLIASLHCVVFGRISHYGGWVNL